MKPALSLAVLLGLSAVARPGDGHPDTQAATVSTAKGFDVSATATALLRLTNEVKGWGGSVGLAVVEVSTGATLVAHNEHAPLNPASNAKLVTAALALDKLGPQHRFVTGLYGQRKGDTIDELVLRGDGDPSLKTPDLFAMASELRALGVRRVRSILVDQDWFDDRYTPPAFEQQPSEWAPFRAPIAAVSINENTVLFQIRATREGESALIDVDPPGFVSWSGAIRTSAKGGTERVGINIEPQGPRLAATLTGSVPEGGRFVRIAKRVEDPRLLAGYALRSLLKQLGIEVPAEVRAGGQRNKELLVTHRSSSLANLIFALGKESDNFYAEMIFKAVGAIRGRPATTSSASEAAEAYLKDVGAFDPAVIVKNGSGLFDANRMTAWTIATLLRSIFRDARTGPDFVAHLSIGGVDGTLRARLSDWTKVRAIRAKTGTLDAVAALSGYVLPPPGRSPIAFSILVNGINGKPASSRNLMDDFVRAIAAELWRGAVPHGQPPS